MRLQQAGVIVVQSNIEPHIAPVRPAPLRQPLTQGGKRSLHDASGFDAACQNTDALHPRVLLRQRSERLTRRGAKGDNELAASHSITSSARSRIDGGTARPSAFAVLRLTTISNLAGNCTGRSPGFAPPRMRST